MPDTEPYLECDECGEDVYTVCTCALQRLGLDPNDIGVVSEVFEEED